MRYRFSNLKIFCHGPVLGLKATCCYSPASFERKSASVSPQVRELEQSLQASEEKLKQSSDIMATQEAQIQELVSGYCGCCVLGPRCFPFMPLHTPQTHSQLLEWYLDPTLDPVVLNLNRRAAADGGSGGLLEDRSYPERMSRT